MRTGRWASPAVALALLITGCVPSGSSYTPEALGLRHSTATSVISVPEPVDPASALLTRAWHTDVRGSFDQRSTRFAFTPGQLLVISLQGVNSVATGNGGARWRYLETKRVVAGHALTGDSFVLVNWGGEDDPRAIGLDSVSGERRWESSDFRPLYGPVQPSGRGVVALLDAHKRSDLVGVDAATGKRRWTWPGPKRLASGEEPCRYVPLDSDGGLLLIQTVCGPEERLFALDPGTGKPVWQRLFQPRSAWAVSRAGYTLVPEDSSAFRGVRLLGRDGREVHRLTSLNPKSGSLVIIAGRAVIGYPSGDPAVPTDDTRRLAGVDLRTGKAGEQRSTQLVEDLAVGKDRVYARGASLGVRGETQSGELLPAGLEVLSPGTLRGTPVPLPSAAASGFWGDRTKPPETQTLLDGGRAYTVETVNGGLRITGYFPGDPVSPPELGGVPARDWPDACALIDGLDGTAYRDPAPLFHIGTQTIRDDHCNVGLDGGGAYDVRVAWVARDPAEADRMLDPEGARPRPIAGLGDEAYGFIGQDDMGRKPSIALRVGRYIAVVESEPGADPRPLAERVVHNLGKST